MRLFAGVFGLVSCAFAAGTTSFHVNYATYLGGSLDEQPAGIAVDAAGNTYVVGTTTSEDFPLTSTDYAIPGKGAGCAFVTKLNATGTGIVWSVCLGSLTGDGTASGNGIALDPSDNVYVLTGDSNGGSSITKLSAGADQIIYSKLLGGSAAALAVDAAGNAYVVGSAGEYFVTTHGAYQATLAPGTCHVGAGVGHAAACGDAFAMKLDTNGSVVYATYLGGSGPDRASAVAVDSQGNAWITGGTASQNFPVTAGAFQSKFYGEVDLGPLRYGDAFVAKLDPTGRSLVYSTYLGGSAPDAGIAIAVDSADAVYVAGGTQSADFPTTAGAYQRTYGGGTPTPSDAGDAFVVKFQASGVVAYSTYMGGSLDENATAIAVDASGNAYVNVGIYPVSVSSNMLSALSVLNPDGTAILKSAPAANLFALDSQGSVYSTARIVAYLFFPSAGAFQSKFGGGTYDTSVVKTSFAGVPSPWITSIANAAGGTYFNVAPGEIITGFGYGFDANTHLLFDGIAAPILYAQSNQINAVVPFGVTGPTTSITLQGAAGQTFGPGTTQVVEALPALFTVDGTGAGQVAALNQDGTVNSATNPAARGSVISVFLTGVGRMTPAQADGSLGPLSPPYPVPVLGVSCDFGQVLWAGAAPGLVAGAVQVNVLISESTPTGAKVAIRMYIGNSVTGSQGDTTIAVR